MGLSSCEGHVTTPLQILDGQYMNQPSHFLTLVQEARKLSQKIKQEEEASQWSGIPVEQLLDSSFTEQLNSIQSLQQIAPLHAVKKHLPKDIITILERLGKVDNTPFNKLYYLAENCVDCYYTSRAHRDGESSQGGTRHSQPPARRWGSFNSNDQLNSSTER